MTVLGYIILGAFALMVSGFAVAGVYLSLVVQTQRQREREAMWQARQDMQIAPRRIVDRDGRETYAGWYHHRRPEMGAYSAFDATECAGSDGRFLLFQPRDDA